LEHLANKGINESGNVALELVIAVALTVTFIMPSVEMVSQVYKSKTELIESLSVIARTFQTSPYELIEENMEYVRTLLQRESKRDLRIFLKFTRNFDGRLSSVTAKAVIKTDVIGFSKLSETRIVKRATFVP
jgi:hypothetical protein